MFGACEPLLGHASGVFSSKTSAQQTPEKMYTRFLLEVTRSALKATEQPHKDERVKIQISGVHVA